MLWLLLVLALSASAQTLTISQAVQQAIEQYPSTRVNEEQIKAAAAGINLARLAYLPKADAIAQMNRATRNNIYGMLLQQQVISPISGGSHWAGSKVNPSGPTGLFMRALSQASRVLTTVKESGNN